MGKRLVIATRASKLAIRQSEIVKELLSKRFRELLIDFLEVTTHGDIDQKTPLYKFGNTGVFIKGLEEKILNGDADLAVHSLKDVPSQIHPELLLVAFPEREDPQDVLVTKERINWSELNSGSVVGTSSPSRKMQMKMLRPDLVFREIRGNVDTRVRKVLNGEYDATILAAAGLKRLGYKIESQQYFTFEEMIPSPGQGALVIEGHRQKKKVIEMLKQVNNNEVDFQVACERLFMEKIGGGCRYPVAAHLELRDEGLIFRGLSYKPGYKKIEKIKISAPKEEIKEIVLKEAEKIIRNNS